MLKVNINSESASNKPFLLLGCQVGETLKSKNDFPSTYALKTVGRKDIDKDDDYLQVCVSKKSSLIEIEYQHCKASNNERKRTAKGKGDKIKCVDLRF